jgi:hypothetical protein
MQLIPFLPPLTTNPQNSTTITHLHHLVHPTAPKTDIRSSSRTTPTGKGHACTQLTSDVSEGFTRIYATKIDISLSDFYELSGNCSESVVLLYYSEGFIVKEKNEVTISEPPIENLCILQVFLEKWMTFSLKINLFYL